MGEVVQSFEEEADMVVVEKENENGNENEERIGNSKEGSSSMVRWERFLPRMGLRVLLVEADDSTRQIIGALLRKCSYKVASVPDGLKAWEVLKARPHNIDLILTEVELPSISGYALLTLIMERDVCKNIPVIMMSIHYSVSMVYKCMLKGAADFLVKPIRINELKNLWQHVWRRQCLNRGVGPRDESAGQQKLEATAENDGTSDHSSSSKACPARQDQCLKKGSDAQSSCGQPLLEAENPDMPPKKEHHSQAQPGAKSSVSDSKLQESSHCVADSGQNLSTPKSTGIAGSEDNAVNKTNDDTLDQEQGLERENDMTEVRKSVDIPPSSSREPIDLLGSLNGHSGRNSWSNGEPNKVDNPQLDLSLMRLFLGVAENNSSACERQLLNHSNASAFTRYVNKTLPPTSTSSPTSASNSKDDRVNSGDHFSENAPGSRSSSQGPTVPHEDGKVRSISLPTSLGKEVENEYRSASQRLFPVPLPVRGGIRVDVCSSPAGYGSGIPPSLSPGSSNNQKMSPYHHHHHHHHQFSVHPDQSPRVSSNQQPMMSDHYDNKKMESVENRAQISSVADQSVMSSTLCNGATEHLDRVGSGGSDNGIDQLQATRDLNLQRSMQREAALNKFRLKRKERCYEKKVRYESRKKLAEQRPRVKGQFVRQVPPDPPPSISDNSAGSSAVKE